MFTEIQKFLLISRASCATILLRRMKTPQIAERSLNEILYGQHLCSAAKLQRRKDMANRSNSAVPEAKDALERFKMEAASEVGVSLKQGYNGDLTSKQAGSIGGQMVKKMIESYEKGLK